MSPELNSHFEKYIGMLRKKIKDLEQQQVEMQIENNQLKDDYERLMSRHLDAPAKDWEQLLHSRDATIQVLSAQLKQTQQTQQAQNNTITEENHKT